VTAIGGLALSVPHEGDSIRAVAFSPDSTRIASGGGDKLIKVRTVGTGVPLDLPSMGFVSSLAFGPNGAALAVADLDQLSVRDTTTGRVLWEGPIEAQTSVNWVRFTPDGAGVVATTDTVVARFDAHDGTPLGRTAVDQTIADADLSRDGTRIVLAIDERHGSNHHNAGSARVLDLATLTELGRLTPRNAVLAVAFSPDGSSVLTCSTDDNTYLFEAVGGRQTWAVPDQPEDEGSRGPSCLAFDPTGTWTVVGGADGFARVLEAESGVEKTRSSHDGAVTHVAFSPNGRWAASAGIDNRVHVFNVRSDGDRFATTTDEVLAMEFSPDNRWLGLGLTASAMVLDNDPPDGG
jgi:WD40 repeat protein